MGRTTCLLSADCLGKRRTPELESPFETPSRKALRASHHPPPWNSLPTSDHGKPRFQKCCCLSLATLAGCVRLHRVQRQVARSRAGSALSRSWPHSCLLVCMLGLTGTCRSHIRLADGKFLTLQRSRSSNDLDQDCATAVHRVL